MNVSKAYQGGLKAGHTVHCKKVHGRKDFCQRFSVVSRLVQVKMGREKVHLNSKTKTSAYLSTTSHKSTNTRRTRRSVVNYVRY